jgi:hypothetical protein
MVMRVSTVWHLMSLKLSLMPFLTQQIHQIAQSVYGKIQKRAQIGQFGEFAA